MDYAAVVLLEIIYMIAFLVLTSAGLAVVFGMMRVINLAHGEFVVLAAYFAVFLAAQFPGVSPLLLIVPVALAAFALK